MTAQHRKDRRLSRRAFGQLAVGAGLAATSGVCFAKPHDEVSANGPAYIDLRGYDGPEDIECDICIAGAGAAGITLARALAKAGRRLVLLESGGFDLDGPTQGLYRGTLTGHPYFSLTSCRLRYCGGTTNHWGGSCNLPFKLGISARPSLGIPAWPIELDAYLPYVKKAAELLGFDPLAFEPFKYPDAAGIDPQTMIDGKEAVLRTQTNLLSDNKHRKFNARYREEIGALPDTRVFLYANLTHIQMMENGSTVRHLTVKTLTGRAITIRPKVTVLACHAIENARLLLASNDVVTPGLGNAFDHVGRYFMDHTHVRAGRFIPASRAALDYYYVDPIAPLGKRKVWPLLALKHDVVEREDLLPYACSLEPVFDPALDATGGAVSRLVKAFFQPFDSAVAADMGTLLTRPGSAAASTLARFGLRDRMPNAFDLVHNIAQAPRADSRVTLTGERDALGVPMVSLNWVISDAEVRTYAKGRDLVGQSLAALGLGTFEPGPPVTPESVRQTVLGHWHHNGTTRMSPAASGGVADPNCRVHGTDNLYVAGSGLFPSTNGSAPTMQLIALAMRLADHLETEGLG